MDFSPTDKSLVILILPYCKFVITFWHIFFSESNVISSEMTSIKIVHILNLLVFICLAFVVGSHYGVSPGWPWTCYINEASLGFTEIYLPLTPEWWNYQGLCHHTWLRTAFSYWKFEYSVMRVSSRDLSVPLHSYFTEVEKIFKLGDP